MTNLVQIIKLTQFTKHKMVARSQTTTKERKSRHKRKIYKLSTKTNSLATASYDGMI